MNSPRRKSAPSSRPAAQETEITAFVAQLEHPLKSGILAVRKTILGVDRSITDGVKWNSISFRTTEYFATVHLRSHDRVQIVFHFGAKTRGRAPLDVAAPVGLVRWLAKDRVLFTAGVGVELKRNLPALAGFVRQWIAHV
ncbi:MAG: hypothetical protein C0518_03375 [Opitutus sp.]|nr:hypothetical protein [Opitutus sp.]